MASKMYRETLKNGRRTAIITGNSADNNSFTVVLYVNNGETVHGCKSFKSIAGARKAAQKFFAQA